MHTLGEGGVSQQAQDKGRRRAMVVVVAVQDHEGCEMHEDEESEIMVMDLRIGMEMEMGRVGDLWGRVASSDV